MCAHARACICVCVCVCVRARVCVCVRVWRAGEWVNVYRIVSDLSDIIVIVGVYLSNNVQCLYVTKRFGLTSRCTVR